MAREGTRSATGNSKPRVFATVDTAPAVTRAPRKKTASPKTAVAKKPTGVTKKKAPKKESAVATKVRRCELGQQGGQGQMFLFLEGNCLGSQRVAL